MVADFEFHKTNKTPEFLATFPLGKIPAAITAEGPLYETNAIIEYSKFFLKQLLSPLNALCYLVLASSNNKSLSGETPFEYAKIQQYVHLASFELAPLNPAIVYPTRGYVEFDANAYKQAKEQLDKILSALDKDLLNKTFFVADRVTLADLKLMSSLYSYFTLILDEKARKRYANVTRWFTTIINMEVPKKVLGDVQLCVTEKFTPK